MTLYFSLLRAFLEYGIYAANYEYVDLPFLKENYPELFRLFSSIPALHEERIDKIYSVADLELCFYRLYPNADHNDYDPLFRQLDDVVVDDTQVQSYLTGVATRAKAHAIVKEGLLIAEGLKPNTDKFTELISSFAAPEALQDDESDFAEDDWGTLLDLRQSRPGLRWRLDTLNRFLGPLYQGLYGTIFARPETGKTTLLASELTFMAQQVPASAGPILWFNNEESNHTVIERCYVAAIGRPKLELEAMPRDDVRKLWLDATHGKLKVIKDNGITKRRVEALCATYRPSLIVFDQIDYIKGFDAERDDLVLEAIYQWARELAKEYAPTIGICQAGASGEGKRWLGMNDMINSKTGKQGAADWILGVGKVFDEGQEFTRFFHLAKNKLPSTAESDEAMRHGKWEVKIRPDLARYEDYVRHSAY